MSKTVYIFNKRKQMQHLDFIFVHIILSYFILFKKIYYMIIFHFIFFRYLFIFFCLLEIKPCRHGSRIRDMEAEWRLEVITGLIS